MRKAPKGTTRGVIVIDKAGKVTAWEQGGPQRTVDVVMAVLPKGSEESKSTASVPTTGTEAGEENAGQMLVTGQGKPAPATEPATTEQPPVEAPKQGSPEQVKTADTAAEVADSAKKIDEHVQLGPST
jgi:thioredoxin-dependent peroxiredoxin